MKNFEKPTIEFIPFGEDIITTSTDKKIENGGDNNEPDWEGGWFEILN